MRATWKAMFPALLFQVQRQKGTENREAEHHQSSCKRQQQRQEATDPALVSVVASNMVSVVPAEQRGSGKARGE